MSKHMATDLDKKPTMAQQKVSYAPIYASFLTDGCCCLNDTDSKILFKIKRQWVNQIFHVTFLQHHKLSHCWWSTWNAGNSPQPVCMSTVSHTAFGMPGESVVLKDDLRHSQVCLVKVTPKRSTIPGQNSPTSHQHMTKCMEMAGKCRGFIKSFLWSQCFCWPSPTGNLYFSSE
jgi:hypothetical protein